MGYRLITPWAILLCKFADDDSEPRDFTYFENLFTAAGAGAGAFNIVDFFSDMSHGRLDLSGSKVFGWFKYPFTREQFAQALQVPGQFDQARRRIVDDARAAASESGVDLAEFYGVVACTNDVEFDTYGGGGRHAAANAVSLNPSILGQEMGHGYGLAHSRRDGSTDDYRDSWDTMSTARAYMASNTDWGLIGPGLNAWNMRSRAWLAEDRVHRISASLAGPISVELRPLHRRDLRGALALELPNGALIEFRVPSRWDAGIGVPVLLMHRFQDNHSYLMPREGGLAAASPGDVFLGADLRIELQSIDAAEEVAVVSVSPVERSRPRVEDAPQFVQLLGDVAVDGQGWLVINGRVVPVPPWDPSYSILERVAAIQSTKLFASPDNRAKVLEDEFLEIARIARGQSDGLQTLQVPAPPDKAKPTEDPSPPSPEPK